MKKVIFAMIVISLFGCSASRVARYREEIYKQTFFDVKIYVDEYSEGKITKDELNSLILGQEDYLKYFVDPVKKLK